VNQKSAFKWIAPNVLQEQNDRLRQWFDFKRKRRQYRPGFTAVRNLRNSNQHLIALAAASLSQVIIRSRAVFLQVLLLGDVNFFFLIHMPEENQQRTGAEHQRQHDGNHARPHKNASRTRELEEFVN